MQLKRTAQMLGTVQKRQLGRKMQILHKLATCFLCKITDAPHTGARLETLIWENIDSTSNKMPPTRGHDLKRIGIFGRLLSRKMPPTRGHDLKPYHQNRGKWFPGMPPTRGHDLKHLKLKAGPISTSDAPHTGARLETLGVAHPGHTLTGCPPHGGTT